jgi:hypothetical protein
MRMVPRVTRRRLTPRPVRGPLVGLGDAAADRQAAESDARDAAASYGTVDANGNPVAGARSASADQTAANEVARMAAAATAAGAPLTTAQIQADTAQAAAALATQQAATLVAAQQAAALLPASNTKKYIEYGVMAVAGVLALVVGMKLAKGRPAPARTSIPAWNTSRKSLAGALLRRRRRRA